MTAPDQSRAVPTPRRRGGAQAVFQVVRTEVLSPHLVRVHLGGPGFDTFMSGADPARLASTDKYVKLLFARSELGLQPPYDFDALREILPQDDLPARRTYTVRSLDAASRTIAIDFVVHGDEGIAGPWAAAAVPGDLLALSGPGGGYSPSTDEAVTHLFIGDDSAIPAIAAALESLTPDARGLTLIEVDTADDELSLTVPAGIEIRWLHRQDGALLAASATEPDSVTATEPGSASAHHSPATEQPPAHDAHTRKTLAARAESSAEPNLHAPGTNTGDLPHDIAIDRAQRPIAAAPGTALVAAVRGLVPVAGSVDVFAHGEREAIKSIRGILQEGWGLDRRSMSLSAYWANGRAEDRFQAEKREPIGQIFTD